MRVLIVAGGYLPGYKYGGPVRSLSAMVEQLGNEIDFFIVTSNRDAGSTEPYGNVKHDDWNWVGNAKVYYASGKRRSYRFWKSILQESNPDIVYLSSAFAISSVLVLFYYWLGMLKGFRIVIAPRGEFAPSALRIKKHRKSAYLRIATLLGLDAGVTFHASSESEADQIREVRPLAASVLVAPNLISRAPVPATTRTKAIGKANFAWVGRISRMKNLVGAIGMLSKLESGEAQFSLYGPVSDMAYWDECLKVAAQLPSNVTFEYHGELPHEHIHAALNDHHFLFTPTLGENFGHTIAEALNQGLPVLVSDRTPWRNLEPARVGWDIPLENEAEWLRTIAECVAMDDERYQDMSHRCRRHVDEWTTVRGGRTANLDMFQAVAHGFQTSEVGD